MSTSLPFRRILMVDDHPFLRTGLRATISLLIPEAEIAEAGSGPEAINIVGSMHPDLALLDIQLPGMSGLDLLRRLREMEPDLQFLMVAADADPWTVRGAMDAGASGFLAKVGASDVLHEALQALAEGRRYLCDQSRVALDRAVQAGPRGAEEPGPAILSDRERQILRFLAQGENTKSIAAMLAISPKTVETHRSHLMWKLGLDGIAALTRYAIRHGLMTP